MPRPGDRRYQSVYARIDDATATRSLPNNEPRQDISERWTESWHSRPTSLRQVQRIGSSSSFPIERELQGHVTVSDGADHGLRLDRIWFQGVTTTSISYDSETSFVKYLSYLFSSYGTSITLSSPLDCRLLYCLSLISRFSTSPLHSAAR
jgi:hypothetical protein